MAVLSRLAVALSVAAATLAAPTADPQLEERGPYNFVLGSDHPLVMARNLTARSNTNYNQDYTTGGSVNFSPGSNQFSVNWNTQNDFVVGVGWNPGTTAPITHSGSFSVNSGLGSLSVYGWTTNPLVEYYVMECNIGISTGGSQKGTVTSDGATYTIWENQRVNAPSIEGTSTFNQYISIRNGCTSSGTVTVANHFNAWASHGMNLGSMNFQVIAVESWSGSGTASQSVSNTGGTSGGGGGSGSGGSCAALWGQCGGQGWTGATCCASGSTCHSYSTYYSQCISG